MYDLRQGMLANQGVSLMSLDDMISPAATDSGSTEGTSNEVHTSKTVQYDATTGDFTLQLEAFLEGTPTTKVRTPTDMILVLDESSSMSFCFACGSDPDVRHPVDHSKVYCVKEISYNADQKKYVETVVPVYYCAGNKVNAGYQCGHNQGGWFDKPHVASTTSQGTRYVPSIANGVEKVTIDNKKTVVKYNRLLNGGSNYTINARIFYEYDSVNGAGSQFAPASDKVSTSGVYYRYNSSNGTFIRMEYCAKHAAWHDDNADPDTVVCGGQRQDGDGNGFAYFVPTSTLEEVTLGETRFFHQKAMTRHAVTTSSDLDTKLKYWVSEKVDGSGNYVRVTYNSTNKKWVTSAGTAYTVAAANSGTTERIFYRPCNQYDTRYEALLDALDIFTDSVYSYSEEHSLNNRMAVVSFASGAKWSYLLSVPEDTSSAKAAPVRNDILTAAENSSAIYASALQDISTERGQSIVNNAIAELRAQGGGTHTHLGLTMAENVLANAPAVTGETKRNKVVVLFTDGEPQADVTGDAYGGADSALTKANALKKAGATVYTIGIFSGANAGNAESVETVTKLDGKYITGANSKNKLMHLASSNYSITDPVPTMANTYKAEDLKTGYYLSGGDTKALQEIFANIAEQINKGGSLEELTGQTVVKDVISPYFALDEVDESRQIAYHTEKCTGKVNGKYVFENDTNSEVDGKIKKTVSGKTITFTGFDFAEHYVAIDKDGNTDLPRGRKLVIQIPIKADVAGGNNLATNNSNQSGVFVGNYCYEFFDTPTVDIPTGVTLTKQVVGANVPAGQTFNFDVDYTKWNGYTNTAVGTSNRLDAEEKTVTDEAYSLTGGSSTSIPEVIVGKSITITEKDVADYIVEYSTDGGNNWTKVAVGADGKCSFTVTVRAGMDIIVRNTLQNADLVIEKKIVGDVNPSQSFLFRVTNTKGFSMEVVIPVSEFVSGKGTVTISGVEVGDYTVTELDDWSWRYELYNTARSQDVEVTPAGGKVDFTNKLTHTKWLSGDSYARNWWNGTGITGTGSPAPEERRS